MSALEKELELRDQHLRDKDTQIFNLRWTYDKQIDSLQERISLIGGEKPEALAVQTM